jgi:hypothetical protein
MAGRLSQFSTCHHLGYVNAMSTHQIERFADNWSYLRTELSWLDHVLIAAVARQRKQTKEVDRIAQTKADRVSSHWWKGIISLDGKIAYDEHRKPAAPTGSTPKLGYQQQLELRVNASRQQNIVLALPRLRDRLGLTLFEKNLVLICLAPEINRRYARLYQYLKGEDDQSYNDLPTVDLILRLLCRNDTEWAAARRSLSPAGTLVQHGFIDLPSDRQETLLNTTLQLSDPLVSFLLLDQPTENDLDCLFDLHPSTIPSLHHSSADCTWDDLLLPPDLLASLKAICDRHSAHRHVATQWGFTHPTRQTGQWLMFTGEPGTGKTAAAHAIAHALDQPLTWVDLSQISPADAAFLIDILRQQPPPILLLKSAEEWFGSLSQVEPALLHQFWDHRRRQGLTILHCLDPDDIPPPWQQPTQTLYFPIPDARDRQQLWKNAFPPQTPLDAIAWDWLAEQFPLSGGQIRSIAHEAAICAATGPCDRIHMGHLLQALLNYGQSLTLDTVENAVYHCPTHA